MTNYARIARTDDETFSDEAEWVAERTMQLMKEWSSDKAKVIDAIADAMSDDGDDYFVTFIAEMFLAVEATDETRELAVAAKIAWAHLLPLIRARHRRDAETAAQAAWDSRLTGPEGNL